MRVTFSCREGVTLLSLPRRTIMGLRWRLCAQAGLLGATASLVFAAQAGAPDAAFDRNVGAFVKKNCAGCHNEQLKTAGLALTSYHDTASLLRDRAVDRKSTRLNSSHMSISYAVFCLKKKR